MERYDPQAGPLASNWLAIAENERIVLVENYHRDMRIPIPKSARRLHARIHVVVENQLALNDGPTVHALLRLTQEGLSRHEVIHALGTVVAHHLHDALNEHIAPETLRAHYYAAVERLSATAWRDGNVG